MVKIIGFAGKKHSGKDTASLLFVEKYGYKRMAFADSLKEMCKVLFGFSDEQLHDRKEEIDEFWGVTPRNVLQYVGTDLFRNRIGELLPSVGENIWVKILEQKLFGENKVVISDVRFPNEVEMIRKYGGIVVYLERNGGENDEHISENGVLECDHIVRNDGNIAELHEKLEGLLC